MANVLVTTSLIAKQALPVLKNMLGFAKNVNHDFEDEFSGSMDRGYAPGATINIKKPSRYTYRSGAVASVQDTVNTTVPLTLTQGGCDLGFSGLEKTVSVSKFDDIMQAAIAPVANEIDRQGLALAHFSVFNTLNPTGALPTSQANALAAITGLNQRLDEMAAPRDGRRSLIMNPALNASMIQGFAGMFNGQSMISKQNESGLVQNGFGISPVLDQNVDVHANGAATATNINGAGQTGSAITVVAIAGGTLTKGTVITLPGVFAVNPQTRQSTGQLANFVVTADALIGATTINVSPALVTSGAFQNVTASPTTGSPYVILGSASTNYSTNIAYHKDAFTLAMVPMWAPAGGKGVISVSQERDPDTGFVVKATQFYDGVNDKAITRLDVLFGWAATYPELACKYYTV